MSETLANLTRVRTEEDELDAFLSTLQGFGFPVHDWGGRGHPGMVFAKAIARQLADQSSLVPDISSGGFSSLAKGRWLDLLAEQLYGLTRAPATRTRQILRISCALGAGPQYLAPGAIALAPSSLNRYTAVAPEATKIDDGGAVDLEFIADAPGASYADGAGAISVLVTPLPGLSISNPERVFDSVPARHRSGDGMGVVTPQLAGTASGGVSGGVAAVGAAAQVLSAPPRFFTIRIVGSGSAGVGGTVEIETLELESGARATQRISPIPLSRGLGGGVAIAFTDGLGSPGFRAGDAFTFACRVSPILRQGADTETDAALAERICGRWPSLGANLTDGGYASLIRQVSIDQELGISRLRVRASAEVAGQADVFLAGPAGAPGPDVLLAVQEFLDGITGPNERASVRGARNRPVLAAGTVAVRSAALVAIRATAQRAWLTYLAGLPVGGDSRTGFPGVVRLADLEQALMDAGAIDVSGLQLNGAAANLPLEFDEVSTVGAPLASSLTWIAV
jgi:hypothetical protein